MLLPRVATCSPGPEASFYVAPAELGSRGGEPAIERLDPYVVEIAAATWDGGTSFRWHRGAERFETWENSYLNILGLGSAVDQALDLGLPAIAERATALGTQLRNGLEEIPGVTIHDLGQERCAIVTATVAGIEARDAMGQLRERGINCQHDRSRAEPTGYRLRGIHPLIRFSPHYYNTQDEITTPSTRSPRSTGSPGVEHRPGSGQDAPSGDVDELPGRERPRLFRRLVTQRGRRVGGDLADHVGH